VKYVIENIFYLIKFSKTAKISSRAWATWLSPAAGAPAESKTAADNVWKRGSKMVKNCPIFKVNTIFGI